MNRVISEKIKTKKDFSMHSIGFICKKDSRI